MARLYVQWCLLCERNTDWVHEPGKPDRCTVCGKHVFEQHKDAAARAAKKERTK